MKLALYLLFWVSAAGAQVKRLGSGAISSGPMNAGESITMTMNPSAVSFALVAGGRAQGSSTLSVSLSWTVTQARQLTVYAYFGSAASALTGGSPAVSIPSSAVQGSVNAGPYQSFSATNPYSGEASGLALVTNYGISGSGTISGTTALRINASMGLQLPAATYTGVILVQAQAL